MTTQSVRLHRVFRASPEKVFRAFVEADAISRWLPPHGFVCTVHAMDAQVGGHYKMSFRNFTTGNSHSWQGEFAELVPGERLRLVESFDDDSLSGSMQKTITLKAVACGTEFVCVHEGIPEAIPAEFCYLGWQESLTYLANLVEPEIADE